jgi:flagellar biosynthesis component FlhA
MPGSAEAAHTYTLLTVGDGLVTQVPALIVSTAARRRACWRSRKSIRARLKTVASI